VVGSNPGGSTPWAIVRAPPGTGFWAKAGKVKRTVAKTIKAIDKILLISFSSQ
jgi:hypothetical protein